MFEEKAKEYRKDLKSKFFLSEPQLDLACQGFKDGYNKANEWHYMKDVNCDEDFNFPSEEEKKGRVLIWKVKVITESGTILPVCYHCGSYDDLWYEINIYYVIAWKEIVLPKESE